MVLNKRLKQLRVDRGLTQKGIADKIGVFPNTVQKFEYGTARPKLENMVKIADFFNVSIDYLVGRTDNPVMNR